MTRSVCVLVSGGLDSCVLAAKLKKRFRCVYPVFIRQGLVWEAVELRHLRRYLRAVGIPSLTILDLPVRDLYGRHWSTTGEDVPDAQTQDAAVYLPGRNLLLLSKTAVFCALREISVIAVGSLGHNPFPDATPKFFRDFAQMAGALLGCRLQIIAPFRLLTKAQVIRRGGGLPLRLSFSCLAPQRGRHCGRCNKCVERHGAFAVAGLADKTLYASRPAVL